MSEARPASRAIDVGDAGFVDPDSSGQTGLAGPVPPVGWRATLRSATVVALGRPRVGILALLAFLARGGIIALALPMVVLPSPIGIGIWVGPTSVGAAGPSARLVIAVAVAVAVAVVVIVGAFALAAAAEVALHQATAAPDPDEPEAGLAVVPDGGRGLSGTIRVALVRLALVIPILLAVGLAIPALATAGYQELTFPSDVAVPLAVRILRAAPLAVATVVVTWLAADVIGGLAARRVVLFGEGPAGAMGGAIGSIVRWPGAAGLSLVATAAVSLLLLVPAVAAAVAAADRAQATLAGVPGPLEALAVALLMTAIFAATVVLAAGAAAWRAALWTAQVLRAAGIRPPGA
ncbi:MAG: hypothetical protein H6Q36_1048 [Chloroflexi bacterium]|jgi:hypothetical protein|nr:hypothetical protein [Chloroflexota bacterium]